MAGRAGRHGAPSPNPSNSEPKSYELAPALRSRSCSLISYPRDREAVKAAAPVVKGTPRPPPNGGRTRLFEGTYREGAIGDVGIGLLRIRSADHHEGSRECGRLLGTRGQADPVGAAGDRPPAGVEPIPGDPVPAGFLCGRFDQLSDLAPRGIPDRQLNRSTSRQLVPHDRLPPCWIGPGREFQRGGNERRRRVDRVEFFDLQELIRGHVGQHALQSRRPADDDGVGGGRVAEAEVHAQTAVAVERVVGRDLAQLPERRSADAGFEPDLGADGRTVGDHTPQREVEEAVSVAGVVAVEGARGERSVREKVDVAVVVIVDRTAASPAAQLGGNGGVDPRGEGTVAVVLVESSLPSGAVVPHEDIQVAVIVEVSPGRGERHVDVRSGLSRDLEKASIGLLLVEPIGHAAEGAAPVGQIGVQITVVVVVDPVPELAVLLVASDRSVEDADEGGVARLGEFVAIEVVRLQRAVGGTAAHEEIEVAVIVVVRPRTHGVAVQSHHDGPVEDLGEGVARRTVVQEQLIGEGGSAGNESSRMNDHEVDVAVVVVVTPGAGPAPVGGPSADVAGRDAREYLGTVVAVEVGRLTGDEAVEIAVVVVVRPTRPGHGKRARGDLPLADPRTVEAREGSPAIVAVEQRLIEKEVLVSVVIEVGPGAPEIVLRAGVTAVAHDGVAGIGDAREDECQRCRCREAEQRGCKKDEGYGWTQSEGAVAHRSLLWEWRNEPPATDMTVAIRRRGLPYPEMGNRACGRRRRSRRSAIIAALGAEKCFEPDPSGPSRADGRSDQTIFERSCHGLGLGVNVQLLVDVLQVGVHGALTDVERGSDGLVALPQTKGTQNLRFPLGQGR